MLSKVFLTVLLLVGISALMVQAQENECGGVSYQGNPYFCLSICPNDGNCVWWGYAQRPDLYPPLTASSPIDLWPIAVNANLTGSQPKVGSIVYFDDTKMEWPGHVAYVQYVNSDNSIEVSEMACGYWYGIRYHRYSLNQVSGFIYGGPVPFYDQRSPGGCINWRESHLLTESNPYSGHLPEHQPLVVFGSRNEWGIHWYHPYVISSQDKFFSDGTPKNCWVTNYVGRSGGKDWDGAIVYDVLGGARSAYVVGWQQWDTWHELLPFGDPEFNPGDGGPNSCLGMPITNSYWTGLAWRQDFQKGYMIYDQVHGYGDDGAQCAPGWSTSGWNHRYSYLFAEAYERNGAAVRVGKAMTSDPGKVHVLSGNILIQDFSGGTDGPGMIMYDMENWDGNECATNEAYWVYGDIKQYYDNHGAVDHFGCATIDRFQDSQNRWCQDFKLGNQSWRIFADGGDPYPLDPCGAVGGPDYAFSSLATFYNMGSDSLKIFAWLTDGYDEELVYQPAGWFDTTGYDATNIVAAAVIDHNNDGFDDLASMYDYPTRTRIHVFLSTGETFDYQGSGGAWDSLGYDSDSVKAMIGGDYDYDGYEDDLAILYSTHNNTGMQIQVLLGANGSFVDYDHFVWFDTTGYHLDDVVQVVGGDFDEDGYKDDIACLYDYGLQENGKYRTRAHVFLGAGNLYRFLYQGSTGWWSVDGYNAQNIVQAEAQDFDQDGDWDIAMVYYYGDALTRIHMLKSTGTSFAYQGSTGWWSSTGYTGTQVKQSQAGFFSDDDLPDLVLVYQYSTCETRYHVFLSTDSSFAYQGATGWWNSTGFCLWRTHYLLAGHFYDYSNGIPRVTPEETPIIPQVFTLSPNYPNPFNPTTTISYVLPTSSHVRVDIFNILGQNITTLIDAQQEPGEYQVTWNAGDQPTGVYFYRIVTDNNSESRKMLLIK